MSALTVTQLDAARRQLRVAIDLWASDGDPVAVHTLVYAAHQIIHDLNRRSKGPHLLLDVPWIPKDKKDAYVAMIKRDANFFKHADARGKKSAPTSIEFTPNLNEMFMMVAITGLTYLREQLTEQENGFVLWYRVHNPDMLNEGVERAFKDANGIESWEPFRQLTKREFLDECTGLKS